MTGADTEFGIGLSLRPHETLFEEFGFTRGTGSLARAVVSAGTIR